VLPFNGKKAYETIIRKVLIDDGGGRTMKADLGLSSQVDTHLEPPAKLVDVGDLSTYVGLEEIDGKGKIIPREKIRFGEPFQL
jgi:N-acyl-D-aspartate/D-glutamate deacylase